MRRRGSLTAAALCAVVLLVIGTATRAQAPTAPAVTLQVPLTSSCECIRDTVTLTATATASAGRTITSVVFQYRLDGATDWTTIVTDTTFPYTPQWSTTFPAQLFGLFEVRAVATDSAGEQSTAIVRDRPVANGGTAVVLDDPGPFLPERVTLRAVVPINQYDPSRMLFQISPADAEQWTDIGLDPEATYVNNAATFSVELRSTDLPGGRYDLRAVASDEWDPTARFVSAPRRARLLDKVAPEATLTVPAAPLSGVVRLTATAQDESGIASVRFERSPAGSGTWSLIDSRPQEPFAIDFDTRSLADGAYDLRVVATDLAGNTGVSRVAGDVAIANAGRVTLGDPSVTSVAAPARDLTLLGRTGTGETWAWGTASGPPAVVDGGQLPYTARGRQLVLLRHTDAGGWQIRDVLRNADGSAFTFRPSLETLVIGQLAASGDAWIALRQPDGSGGIEGALFHRAPGGQFRRDPTATDRLAPLLTASASGAPKRLQIGQDAGGHVFGILVAPLQTATAAGGVQQRLRYGLLDGDDWRLETLALPSGYAPRTGDQVTLRTADLAGPGSGWVGVEITNPQNPSAPKLPPRIGRLAAGAWTPVTTGLDVLDATDAFAEDTPALTLNGLRAARDGVWIGVSTASSRNVVAYYDEAAHEVTQSWCEPLGRASRTCRAPLDADHPAALPDQVFETANGPVAVALQTNFLHTLAYGVWSRSAAPGFERGPGRLLLSGPEDGWLAGPVAFGRVTAEPLAAPATTWPQANRSTLLSVALPPGSNGGVDESGALAVGLDGAALAYDAGAGWQVYRTPPRAGRQPLRAVAFSAPTQAFAVGGSGIILRWDGAQWTEDPQSGRITTAELQSVAFDGRGEGWAVGRFATILHFDGSAWTEERPPPEDVDSGATVSSVAVAGDDVFAVSDGNLIQRDGDGQWHRVERSRLPDQSAQTPPFERDLRVVAGLPDGGLVAAGRQVVLTRQGANARFEYAAQPVEGVVVGLSAFRDGDGTVRAFASVAAPIPTGLGTIIGGDVGGFPAGDGTLLRQTSDGWVDLSNNQPPLSRGELTALIGDGLLKPDPVLAVAAAPDGRRAWAVGGYAGTRSAAGQGLDDVLAARPAGWYTAHIWRYDAGGSAQSPADVPTTVTPSPPAANTVTFAYFSNPQCRWACVATQDAQPDVNLTAALRQIDQYASQPGGPAFAMLGGNARGPVEQEAWLAGNGEAELARLPSLLAAGGQVPLFAAVGPRDAVPTREDQLRPWADAFARSPAPFGPRPAPAGIVGVAQGGAVGGVHRYYAFDAQQNGAVIRAIVLDNSNPDLSAPPLDDEQSAWLDTQLAAAAAAGRPTVVFLSQPLNTRAYSAHLRLAFRFVDAKVVAVFAPGDTNGYTLFPAEANQEFQIPLITGGTLGYQRSGNNGVAWFSVTIDVAKRTVASVEARPVLESLALKPLLGLTVNRSQTLAFEAIGRRPTGTLATTPGNPTFPGFDNYVTIPAPACVSLTCILPGYEFKSSDPTIGDFVLPRGPGSRYPLLDNDGKPIRSSSSGLFCAYNAGTTNVSITVGTRRATLPVTVRGGGFGRPCGTVFREGQRPVVVVPRERTQTTTAAPRSEAAPSSPPPSPAQEQPALLPNIPLPFPPPPAPAVERPAPAERPAPQPAPQPVPPVVRESPPPVPAPVPAPVPVAVPPIPPNIQPIPPGGAASAQAAARRKEKVRKHASQSAYTTHVPGEPWFYGGVGVTTVLTLLLIAGGVRPGPRRRAAPALLRFEPRRRP